MALSADILRGYTDTIILHQLSHGDSYGYQINKTISTLSGGEVELKEATLYTAFRRLEAAGLIQSYWGSETSGARRRYYAITALGQEKLISDLAERLIGDTISWEEISRQRLQNANQENQEEQHYA